MTPEGRAPGAAPRSGEAEKLDAIAWQILGDLFKPDAAFASFPHTGLQHLIGLRLVEEARRNHVAPEALAVAFDRAWQEFSGRDRPARDPADDDSGPLETVDDL